MKTPTLGKPASSDARVRVNLGATVTVGPFESMRADVSLEDVVAEGETYEQAYARLRERAHALLADEVRAIRRTNLVVQSRSIQPDHPF